jgi:hypothetical protein
MYEPEEQPSFLSRYGLPIGVGAGLVILAIIVVFLFAMNGDDDGGGSNAGAQPTAAASPTQAGANPQEQALAQYVQNTLKLTYAGDCSGVAVGPGSTTQTPGAATTQTPGTDRLCSAKRGEREGVTGFVLGQPLSEPSQWAFVSQNNGAWQVVSAPKITADTRAIPGIPWPLKPGAEVVVIGTGDCLNVREGPALNQAAVDCIADGTKIKVAAGPADSDGIAWWQVEGRSGWVAADYLRFPDAAQ